MKDFLQNDRMKKELVQISNWKVVNYEIIRLDLNCILKTELFRSALVLHKLHTQLQILVDYTKN